MVDPESPKVAREDRALRCVAFQVAGSTFAVVRFDTKAEAKAHALSFVSVEPKFDDNGLTEFLGETALQGKGE